MHTFLIDIAFKYTNARNNRGIFANMGKHEELQQMNITPMSNI